MTSSGLPPLFGQIPENSGLFSLEGFPYAEVHLFNASLPDTFDSDNIISNNNHVFIFYGLR